MLKQRIDQDLKKALLAGDKSLATTLRGLKSVILYAEVAQGLRDTGLPDEEIILLFSKEVKKRDESAALYTQGGNSERAAAELAEKAIIEQYLPLQLSNDDLRKLVDDAVTETGAASLQDMGKVIGLVKAKAAGSADGSRIAVAVKERLANA